MTILFVILISVASIILGLIVLIQNPKGGGLAGNIAGFSNQFMGVKQTNDVLEKSTWAFGAIIAALCLGSYFFFSASATASGADSSEFQNLPQPGNTTTPSTTAPFNPSAQPEDSVK